MNELELNEYRYKGWDVHYIDDYGHPEDERFNASYHSKVLDRELGEYLRAGTAEELHALIDKAIPAVLKEEQDILDERARQAKLRAAVIDITTRKVSERGAKTALKSVQQAIQSATRCMPVDRATMYDNLKTLGVFDPAKDNPEDEADCFYHFVRYRLSPPHERSRQKYFYQDFIKTMEVFIKTKPRKGVSNG